MRIGPREIVVRIEPARELVARLEVHADPAGRARRLEAPTGSRFLPADIPREDELAVEVEEPERRRRVESIPLPRAGADLVPDGARQGREAVPFRQ